MTTVEQFFPTFCQSWLFRSLSQPVLEALADKLKLHRFEQGASIYREGQLPALIHCVVSGGVRLLGGQAYESPTLKIVGRGAVIGWDSLIRQRAAGAAQATSLDTSSEVLTLALPADDFEDLAVRYLLPTLAQQVSIVELFDIMTQFVANLPEPYSAIAVKDLVQHIDRQNLAVAAHWYPRSAQPLEAASQLSLDRVWIVSSEQAVGPGVGIPVSPHRHLIAPHDALFPLRLIGINQRFLATVIFESTVPLPATPPLSVAAVPLSTDAVETLQPTVIASRQQRKYPVWRSSHPTGIEDSLACLGMLATYLEVPYRIDLLRNWLTRHPPKTKTPLELCARLLQSIGLEAEWTETTATAGGLNRLTLPCLILSGGIPCVLYAATPQEVVLASPRLGLLRFDATLVAEQLSPAYRRNDILFAQALVVKRTDKSRSRQFGWQWFTASLYHHRLVLSYVLIASFFVQLLGLVNPLLVQQVINKVIIERNIEALPLFGGLLIGFAAIEACLTILRTYLLSSTTNRIDVRIGRAILHHLLRLPIHFFEAQPVGELSSRLNELERIRRFLTGTALTACLDVLFSVVYIAVMLIYSVPLTLCVLSVILLVVLLTLIVSRVQKRLIRIRSDQSSKVQSYLIEVLSGIFTIKTQSIEPLVEATWNDRYLKYLRSSFTTITVGTIFSTLSNFLNTLSSLVVLWVGATFVLQGRLSLGGLIAFRIIAGYVTGTLNRTVRLWEEWQETVLSFRLVGDIANFPPEATGSDQTLKMPPIQGQVEYQSLSFGFNQSGPLQLHRVNVTIAPGMFVGVVGLSGSGKSTFVKLLARLYEPNSGKILIDGFDIQKVDLYSLRVQLGVVPQNAVLFEGTIRQNIALFQPVSDDAIIQAAKLASAHEFIMSLPDGYETRVGERGAGLSGGQCQRIAIARVILTNPRLLIFDEATSALDYQTEIKVYQNLRQHFRGRTSFFVTHRLSTLAQADWILFMRNGVVAEQGTHRDLLHKRQLYYSLYTQQESISDVV